MSHPRRLHMDGTIQLLRPKSLGFQKEPRLMSQLLKVYNLSLVSCFCPLSLCPLSSLRLKITNEDYFLRPKRYAIANSPAITNIPSNNGHINRFYLFLIYLEHYRHVLGGIARVLDCCRYRHILAHFNAFWRHRYIVNRYIRF